MLLVQANSSRPVFDSSRDLPTLPTMPAIQPFVSDGALLQDIGSPPSGALYSPPKTPEQAPAEGPADPFRSSQHGGSTTSLTSSPTGSQASVGRVCGCIAAYFFCFPLVLVKMQVHYRCHQSTSTSTAFFGSSRLKTCMPPFFAAS